MLCCINRANNSICETDMSDQTPPAMDYAEHERTYEGFLKLSRITCIAIGSILWALLMFSFGGGMGMVLGTVTIIGAAVAVVIGLFSKGEGWMPSAIVFGVAMVFLVACTL